VTVEGTDITVFKAGEQELTEMPFGDYATVAVWQGIGGSGIPDKMGVGYADYRGTWDWVPAYDAVYYMLAGELNLTRDGVTHTASAGDVMFIPRGSVLSYDSPDGCRVFWAIDPGNWEQISDFSVPERTARP
jgi:ethanolamine utilization protein EutQ (cupin superfamily)